MRSLVLVSVFVFALFLRLSTAKAEEATAASVLSTSSESTARSKPSGLSLTPMIGTAQYSGDWHDHIRNHINFGVALEMPFDQHFAGELELGYSKSTITYSNYAHDFKQYTAGANAKAYLTRQSVVRPYVGLGILSVTYADMTHGPRFTRLGSYNHTVWSGQLLAGAEASLSEKISVGVRGSWIVPVINRAEVQNSGLAAFNYYDEAAAINTSFMKLVAHVTFAL